MSSTDEPPAARLGEPSAGPPPLVRVPPPPDVPHARFERFDWAETRAPDRRTWRGSADEFVELYEARAAAAHQWQRRQAAALADYADDPDPAASLRALENLRINEAPPAKPMLRRYYKLEAEELDRHIARHTRGGGSVDLEALGAALHRHGRAQNLTHLELHNGIWRRTKAELKTVAQLGNSSNYDHGFTKNVLDVYGHDNPDAAIGPFFQAWLDLLHRRSALARLDDDSPMWRGMELLVEDAATARWREREGSLLVGDEFQWPLPSSWSAGTDFPVRASRSSPQYETLSALYERARPELPRAVHELSVIYKIRGGNTGRWMAGTTDRVGSLDLQYELTLAAGQTMRIVEKTERFLKQPGLRKQRKLIEITVDLVT